MRFIGLELFISRENIAESWEGKTTYSSLDILNSRLVEVSTSISPLRFDDPGKGGLRIPRVGLRVF